MAARGGSSGAAPFQHLSLRQQKTIGKSLEAHVMVGPVNLSLAVTILPFFIQFFNFFVGTVQAFVFTLLAIVYLSLSIAEDH